MMKMNKATLLLSVIGLAFAGSAMATDGTITINGKITDTTCNISVDNQTNNATVTLPTVSATALNGAGITAGATPFKIALTGCSGATLNTASTMFEAGTYVDMSTGRLNNSASATAGNVQVELLNSALSPIVAGAAQPSQNDIAVDISSGAATMNYFARYYATAAATAGSVNTQVDYTVV